MSDVAQRAAILIEPLCLDMVFALDQADLLVTDEIRAVLDAAGRFADVGTGIHELRQAVSAYRQTRAMVEA